MKKTSIPLTHENIEEMGYIQLEALHHDSLLPFVQKNLWRVTRINLLFLLCCVLILTLYFILLHHYRSQNLILIADVFAWKGIGLLLMAPLIPLHEWIHGVFLQSCRSEVSKN
jgi:hypothetical protein